MALEIERKFQLPEAPPWLRDHPGTEVEQGYLAIDEDVEVRLRRAGSQRFLTVKSGHGKVRDEAEAGIDARQFWAFWPLTESRRLEKVRYRVPLASLTVEIDVFGGDLAGLVLAEIEFESEGDSEAFQAPDWLGREVTGDQRFANQALVEDGAPPDVDADSAEAIGKVASMSSGHEEPGPSGAYRLKGKEKPKQGLRRIARGRAQNAIDELQEPDSEAVHEARKDLKKLRSVLRLVRDDLDRGFYRKENKRFRKAGRGLAAPRDAKVKLETLASLQSRFSGELQDDALSGYRVVLEQERRATMDALADGGVDEVLGAIAVGRNRATDWRLQGRGWAVVGRGLVRSYRRGRKAMKAVHSNPGTEEVHEWRKRTKDLWYQLRILREARPEVIEATADEVHELSDLLGDHHDLAVLVEDVRERDELFADRDVVRPLLRRAAERQGELLVSALERGERLYAEKPKAFGRRFEAYWGAWRPA